MRDDAGGSRCDHRLPPKVCRTTPTRYHPAGRAARGADRGFLGGRSTERLVDQSRAPVARRAVTPSALHGGRSSRRADRAPLTGGRRTSLRCRSRPFRARTRDGAGAGVDRATRTPPVLGSSPAVPGPRLAASDRRVADREGLDGRCYALVLPGRGVRRHHRHHGPGAPHRGGRDEGPDRITGRRHCRAVDRARGRSCRRRRGRNPDDAAPTPQSRRETGEGPCA